MTDDVLDTLVVPTQLGGARVDRVVAELFELPTNAARRLCERGRVFVDGKKVKKGDRVNPGAVVFLQGGGTWLVPVDDATVHTLYVDDELVIVDKPALMPCHPLVPQEGGTALDLVAARYPDVAEGFDEPREGGLLHRLDTGTSGCLAFARDPIVRQRLRGRFEEADKRYLALVEGAIVRSVVVDLPVGHDPKDPRRMLVDDDGREAQTDLAPRGVGQGPQGP